MIRNYVPGDEGALLGLWNTAGVKMGYAPLTQEKLRQLLTRHPHFESRFTFVLEQTGEVLGFVNGCTGADIPRGDVRGYLSCLVLAEPADTAENAGVLLGALEAAFRAAGRSQSAVTFFNPIRLPWVIPGTDGHQHNNAPGIAEDIGLYDTMLKLGYRAFARECAMYRDLSDYEMPDLVRQRELAMAREGYTVARYDPERHTGLQEMLDSLGNPEWPVLIPRAAEAGQELLVGLCGDTCAGFTGPIWPEETGRGYFAGIGVAPQYEKHGLGTLLFHRLMEREKAVGARYMSLFTGEENHAQKIYLSAGFRIVRKFGVMIKEL